MAKWKEIPSPEAIVREALERAAQAVQMCIWGNHWRHDDFGDVEPEELADVIRSFADDPAEVSAILKKAAGGGSGMSDDLVAMARLAQRDERMSTGALYGDLADRIEELEAQNELLEHMIASLPPPHPDNTLRNRLAQRRALMDNPAEVAAIIKRQGRIGDE